MVLALAAHAESLAAAVLAAHVGFLASSAVPVSSSVLLPVSAAADSPMFLGDDLIPYLVLALGGALLVGNLGAMLRPRQPAEGGASVRAPARRAVPLALVGLVAAIWALATLMAG